MTFLDMLRDAAARNQSMLCVGLDPEPTRFPAGMQGDVRRIYDFCAAIVDATADLVIFTLNFDVQQLGAAAARISCAPARPAAA